MVFIGLFFVGMWFVEAWFFAGDQIYQRNFKVEKRQ